MYNNVSILSHLGLGDHFIVHGVVRKLYDTLSFDKMYIVVKKRYYDNVKFMFRDLDKIDYIKVPNESTSSSAKNYLSNISGKKYDCWWYGHSAKEVHEEELYTSLGFSWKDKYDYFKVNRDLDREDYVYSKVVDSDEPYLFVGDDPSRGYVIDPSKALGETNMRIIRSHDLLDYTLFDLLKVMEKAHSLHIMYNSFFVLADCMSLNKIYLHNSYLNKIDPLESYGEPMKNLLTYRNITAI